MWWYFILLSLTAECLATSHIYHAFNASELSSKGSVAEFCTITVDDCKEAEYRRLDGTCNNLKEVSRGASNTTPLRRWLPASYDEVTGIRKAKSGKPLPNARVVRTEMLLNGRASSSKFTILATNMLSFMASDVIQPSDAETSISTNSCCSSTVKTDPRCRPITIPEDDPVLRFSGHRCMNYSRPLTYQSTGCISNDTAPELMNRATPAFDLSQVYGTVNSITKFRQLKNGLLKSEEVEGRIWPPQIEDAVQAKSYCVQNNGSESRCHDTPNKPSNGEIGTNLFTIWYWRLHNHIAKQLSALNPCWDDSKIFDIARDINIAYCLQMYFYELLPSLFGQDSLVKDEIIANKTGFRDVYDETLFPQISYEYVYAQRWIHTIQEGMLKLYDTSGKYLKSFPSVNMTYRTGHLALENNMDLFTQGSFRQSCADVDNVIDPDLAERAYGAIQEITDITAVDIEKGRDFGMQPYVIYRQKCGGENITITTWENLAQVLNTKQAERLQSLYDTVEDIDLIVGMWAEKPMNGSDFPQTFYSMIADGLKRYVKSDRHWYEREKRPNAFTKAQLDVIRKATVAGLLCTVGDKVTQIQPNAFLKARVSNEMVPCNKIAQFDPEPWKFECPKPTTLKPRPPPKNSVGSSIKSIFKKGWRKFKKLF